MFTDGLAPNVTARSDALTIAASFSRRATCAAPTASGDVPKALLRTMRTRSPPRLVWTIWRSVWSLKLSGARTAASTAATLASTTATRSTRSWRRVHRLTRCWYRRRRRVPLARPERLSWMVLRVRKRPPSAPAAPDRSTAASPARQSRRLAARPGPAGDARPRPWPRSRPSDRRSVPARRDRRETAWQPPPWRPWRSTPTGRQSVAISSDAWRLLLGHCRVPNPRDRAKPEAQS